MKSIVNSQLTGKWYQIAKGENRCENDFVELMVYLSICCDDKLDMLYVGVERDGKKKLKKLSLKVLAYKDFVYLVVGNILFGKRLKILTFDAANGLMIIADEKMRYFSILSKKPNVGHELVEKALSEIDFFKQNDGSIKLYSDNIF